MTNVETKVRTKNFREVSLVRWRFSTPRGGPVDRPTPFRFNVCVCCGCKFGSGHRRRCYFRLVIVMMAAVTELSWPTWHLHDAQLSAFTENLLLRSLPVKFSTELWFNMTFRPYKCWHYLYNRPLCSHPQRSHCYTLCSYRNRFVSVLGPMWGIYCRSVIYRRIIRRIARTAQIIRCFNVQFTLHGASLLTGKYLLNSVRFPRKKSG